MERLKSYLYALQRATGMSWMALTKSHGAGGSSIGQAAFIWCCGFYGLYNQKYAPDKFTPRWYWRITGQDWKRWIVNKKPDYSGCSVEEWAHRDRPPPSGPPSTVGFATFEEMKQRTLDIVSGKLTPKPDEPKIWFIREDINE